MKLLTLSFVFCFFLKTFLLETIQEKSSESFSNTKGQEAPTSPSDGIYKRIIANIYTMAEKKMKSSDLLQKKKISGSLPDGFSSRTKILALKSRDDLKKWKRVLSLPTELYRVCIYSRSNLNYFKWCNNNFLGSSNKKESKNIFFI